jgi:hypothetical protein
VENIRIVASELKLEVGHCRRKVAASATGRDGWTYRQLTRNYHAGGGGCAGAGSQRGRWEGGVNTVQFTQMIHSK